MVDLYKRKRGKFKSFDDFINWYNCVRPHMSLDWDNLETPEQAFWRKLEPALVCQKSNKFGRFFKERKRK